MSTIKVYALGGLDKKSNDLTRATDKASDMINMEYDTQSTIKKRNGFASVTATGVFNVPANPAVDGVILDSIYYSYRDEIILFTRDPSGLFLNINKLVRNGASWVSTNIAVFGIGSWTGVLSYEESQFSIYFTLGSNSFSQRIFKYDGSFLIYSGLFVPHNTYVNNKIVIEGAGGIFSGVSSPSGYYVRVIPKYTDYNGTITYGPYIQSTSQWNTLSTITVTRFNDLNNYVNFCYVTNAGVPFTLNSTTRTIPTLAGDHNYLAGDKFLVLNTANSSFFQITSPAGRISVQLIVESVTTTSITFTAASLAGISIVIQTGSFIFDRRCEYVIAISQTKDTGYYITKSGFVDSDLYVVNNRNATSTISWNDTGFSSGTLVPLLSLYDTTTLKKVPPLCNYIAAMGGQLVYGNIYSVYDLNNQPIIYQNADLVMYSDVSTGDGPENISDLNRQRIGETWDGQITGLKRCNDSMIIFKERGVFSIDGYLIQGQYSLRKINTNSVGSTTNRSILVADEGLYFQGHNGLYFTNGVNASKLTYEIDSLFLSGSYLNTRSVRMKKKQKSIFYVPDLLVGTNKIVVIDYYYNQIYLWNNISASAGIFEDKNGDVYFLDGANLLLFNDLYSDNGTAITSSYSSTWHHAGEPALNKKFLSLRMWGLTTDAFTATVTTQGDWDTSTNLTTNQLVFSSTDQTKFVMLDMKTKKSLRVTFSNANNNENMAITGYELTYEPFNVVDKN